MRVVRVAVSVLLASCGCLPARAGDAFLGIEKPKNAALGSWAKVDGLDVSWETARAGDKEGEAKYETLAFSIALSPVSAYLADSHRTARPIPALYLRLSEDDGATRFYKLSNIVVPDYERAPVDKPQAPEAATIIAERIQLVSP